MTDRVPRRWTPRSQDQVVIQRLVQEVGVSRRVARLLAGRGVTEPDQAVKFLEPTWEDLHDPFLIPGMARACRAVHQAIAAGEVVTLYGDYDVDGTCATALLFWVFKKLKAPVRFHAPDRSEGYGLSKGGIDAAVRAGSTLIVTMDQGISAVAEIAYAAERGVRVLVTDHHTPPAVLPAEAVEILHPSLHPGYPNPALCGAGMAFKLGEALLRTAENPALRASAEGYVKSCIDLTAIATIADVSPLVGENRAIVALGLHQLGRTRHPGLKAMLQASRRGGAGAPQVADVAFGIAPMMNAAGRLSGPELTLDCLLSRDPREAARLAKELGALNQRRRELTEELMELALEQRDLWARERVGVLRLPSDQVGIVGLVAGRLKEIYWKPFVVCAEKGDELVGSCRSVDGFDVRAALDQVGDHLERYGGHAQAAGLTVRPERFEDFAADLRAHAGEALPEALLEPRLEVDEVLGVEDLSFELLDEVSRLRPFGAGNPAPVFVLEGCAVDGVKVMGQKGAHVRLQGRGFPEHLDPVGFHLRGTCDRSLADGTSVDMAFQLGDDEWRGRKRIQMRLEDLRAAGGARA